MEQVQLAKPKLRPQVEIAFEATGAILRNGDAECELSFPMEARDLLSGLFASLAEGGRDIEDLQRLHADLDGIPQVLASLDGARLLTETAFAPPTSTVSGAQLFREVRRLSGRLVEREATEAFVAALRTGAATRRQVIGYALEYYWLVRAAPALLAPSLATCPDLAQRRVLQDFLASELNHDQQLGEALRAVGVDPEGLTHLQPLPTTFAICASLGVFAQQHPLSFYASLFLFEEPREAFVEAFEQRCRELELPPAFVAPFRWHAELNDDGGHDEISAKLMGAVAVVGAENQIVVKRNVSVLVETLLWQEAEILAYYGDSTRPSPRVFA